MCSDVSYHLKYLFIRERTKIGMFLLFTFISRNNIQQIFLKESEKPKSSSFFFTKKSGLIDPPPCALYWHKPEVDQIRTFQGTKYDLCWGVKSMLSGDCETENWETMNHKDFAHINYTYYLLCDFDLSNPFVKHHYIKGHISVFGRGFICFCCLEPNFLHGVSCPYCPEYWRVSSVVPQKNWGVWTHFLIFDPFYWLEKQPACDKSCIETAFECSFSFWNPFNLSAYGLFLHDMSEEHIVPKLA